MLNITNQVWSGLDAKTQLLMNRMLNPLCGIVQEIGFIKRAKFGSRVLTAGADLSGVHNLLNLPNPGRGAYHTGGAGIFLNEPLIKSLGESIERYSQLVSELNLSNESLFASYAEMQKRNENIISPNYLDLYDEQQLAKNNFPFQNLDEALPLTWLKLPSVFNRSFLWVPAQLLLVGYQIKKDHKEPWYTSAVTTGTAAHVDLISALLNALLEIIQIDGAMGHWYGNYPAPEIIFDERSLPMFNVLKKYAGSDWKQIKFYWLKNPDLRGISVACLIAKPEKSMPRIAIGLGASASLNDALYKAYLEAIGVASLSNLIILRDMVNRKKIADIDYQQIYDLDNNVALYGKGQNLDCIEEKFNRKNKILASKITPDITGDPQKQFNALITSFKDSNKEINFIDLTNSEARDLGFYVVRLWCKETLSLCLPSAPPIKHPRFKVYGGFSHAEPHPYP